MKRARCYPRFTTGLLRVIDTPDLKEAKILLDELNEKPAAPAHLNGRPPQGGVRQSRIQIKTSCTLLASPEQRSPSAERPEPVCSPASS